MCHLQPCCTKCIEINLKIITSFSFLAIACKNDVFHRVYMCSAHAALMVLSVVVVKVANAKVAFAISFSCNTYDF